MVIIQVKIIIIMYLYDHARQHLVHLRSVNSVYKNGARGSRTRQSESEHGQIQIGEITNGYRRVTRFPVREHRGFGIAVPTF